MSYFRSGEFWEAPRNNPSIYLGCGVGLSLTVEAVFTRCTDV